MERNFMNPDSLAEFDFVEDLHLTSHYHENIELLFILDGEMRVTVEDSVYQLRRDDIIVINSSRYHSYEAQEGILAVRIQISYLKVRKLLHQNHVMFWCCSCADQNEAYGQMRDVLMRILSAGIDQNHQDEIYLNSLYYQLLSLLCANFLINEKNVVLKEEKNSDRIQEIFEYIRANYRDPISLQDVADELYLSPTYLSKFIRRNTGMGFVELINSVRLGHAMEDLMYTDASIMKIAMDNGFASVAALNKVFRETYGMTPSEFRKEKKTTDQKGRKQNEQLVRKAVEYLSSVQPDDVLCQKDEIYAEIDLKQNEEKPFGRLFSRMINAGTAEDLSRTACQNEILLCQKKLGIRYVRFWNLFDSKMLVNIHADAGKINFGKIDEILDFLVNHDLKPYIELLPKRHRLIGSMGSMLYENDEFDDFVSEQERNAFYTAFIRHLLKRFGTLEVQSWYFDYCMRPDTVFQEGHFELRPLSGEELKAYFNAFAEIAALFRKYVRDFRIGGAGFPVQHYGMEGLQEIFEMWKGYPGHPSFISVTSFPYQIVRDHGVTYERRRTDPGFLTYDLERVKDALNAAGFDHPEIHVTEFNITLSSRNPVNDSLYRAAYLVYGNLRAQNLCTLIGIWNLRDSYAELADSPEYLFGGSGILTKTGVGKPAFTAADFMNRMYERQIYLTDDLAITANQASHLKVICHNMRKMNVTYYMTDEDQIKAENLELMSEDYHKKHIHIRVCGTDDHMWQIRQYRMNQEHGSVLNEWIHLGMDSDMIYEDMKYLEQTCVPGLYVRKIRPENGVLEFDILLEPNEVQYLHITHAGE